MMRICKMAKKKKIWRDQSQLITVGTMEPIPELISVIPATSTQVFIARHLTTLIVTIGNQKKSQSAQSTFNKRL